MVQQPPGYQVVVWLSPSQPSGWQRRRIYHKTFWTTTMATSCHQMVYAGCQCCPVFCWLVLTLGACMCGEVTCRGEPKLNYVIPLSLVHSEMSHIHKYLAIQSIGFYITFTNVIYVAEILIWCPCLWYRYLPDWIIGQTDIGCHSCLIQFFTG